MAVKLDDQEFWLPSEFLTDDDLLMGYRNEPFGVKDGGGFSNGFGFFSGFNSDLSSTETDSDEEDFVSGITLNMKNASLQSSSMVKGRKLYGSPQSALSGYNFSNAPSPTEAKPAVGWDLLYKAAEEVARMRMAEEMAARKYLAPQQKPPPVRNACPIPAFHGCKSQIEARLAYLQLQATQFQRMKLQQQQIMKRGIWAASPAGISPESWPTLQQSTQQQSRQQPFSAAVFVGENRLKKERNGTGVFLPRRIGTNAAETRRKPAVLLPEKVVHAFNVNTRPMVQNFPAKAAAVSQELRLPPEWSY